MDSHDYVPFQRSRDLPPYRGILAVDAKGFTAEPGSAHEAISILIPTLVGRAFTKVGLGDVWSNPIFFGPTGDGFAIGVPTEVLPYLVHPFLAELQHVLEQHNHETRHGEARIQLRASLHVGPLPADPHSPNTTGNGKPRNDTHRLLDSEAVRKILGTARPEVTFLATVLSDRVFEDVVQAGYAGRHPAHFVEVSARVPSKDFTQRAWLYVPQPSGNLLQLAPKAVDALPSASARAGATEPAGASTAQPAVRIKHNRGQAAGIVQGDMRQEGKR